MTTAASNAMAAGRRADTARRRERVEKTLSSALKNGQEITAAGIARSAGVDRSFLYRHRDLLHKIQAAETQATATGQAATTTSRASLRTDLLAAHERANRLATRISQLEHRLSQLLGETAWQQSGLGAPDDIDQLKTRITELEQHVIDQKLRLDEAAQDLTAARAANRELMTQLNTR